MAAPQIEAIVVGAGVIGLAVARALAQKGHEVVVLEAEPAIGRHQSSRSSEVLHAGLYYRPSSLKARLCVQGRRELVALCEREGVPYRQVGKLVVATEAREIEVLERIEATAIANGVEHVQLVEARDVKRLEPHVRSVAALVSPVTGIIDSHALLRLLARQGEDLGVTVALTSPVRHVRVHSGGLEVSAGNARVRCRLLVNAAGLGAHAVAQAVEDLPPACIPARYLAKGSYFRLRGSPRAQPFTRLVYPVPDTASLGIHATLDLQGGVRFGPDQEWVDEIDYAVDVGRAPAFHAAVRRFWPALPDGALLPDLAGVRAKIQGPGDPPADFVVSGPADHGVPGLVNLFGIESPGLTACLPLAELAAARLLEPPRR